MTENPLTQFLMAAAIIWGTVLVLKAVKPFLPTNGHSNQFKAAVDAGLNDRVVPILDRQTDILQEMAKGINELVIIQRDERVRRAAAGE